MPSRRTSRLKSRIARSKPRSSTVNSSGRCRGVVPPSEPAVPPLGPLRKVAHGSLATRHCLRWGPLHRKQETPEGLGPRGASQRVKPCEPKAVGTLRGLPPLCQVQSHFGGEMPRHREGQNAMEIGTPVAYRRERFGIRGNLIETGQGRRSRMHKTARAPRRRLALARRCPWV
jgi:hypothetical protein